jgi:hypothetical protein
MMPIKIQEEQVIAVLAIKLTVMVSAFALFNAST